MQIPVASTVFPLCPKPVYRCESVFRTYLHRYSAQLYRFVRPFGQRMHFLPSCFPNTSSQVTLDVMR